MIHLALGVLAQAIFSADWSREAEVMAPAVEVAIGHAYHQLEAFVTPARAPADAARTALQAGARPPSTRSSTG